MEETVKTTITDIVAQTAIALQEAVEEYGPAAVELGLFVFQVDAIYTLILCTLPFLIMSSLFWLIPWAKKVDKTIGYDDSPYHVFVLGLVGTVSFISVALSIDDLFNPFIWLAAFGSPEAMIAKNALKAAGLM